MLRHSHVTNFTDRWSSNGTCSKWHGHTQVIIAWIGTPRLKTCTLVRGPIYQDSEGIGTRPVLSRPACFGGEVEAPF